MYTTFNYCYITGCKETIIIIPLNVHHHFCYNTECFDFGLQLLYYGMYKGFSVHPFYSTECVGFFTLCNSFKTFLINQTTIIITLNVTHISNVLHKNSLTYEQTVHHGLTPCYTLFCSGQVPDFK